MPTPEESALLQDMTRRLRELHVRRAEAQSRQDQAGADALQAEIEELTDDCDKVLDAAEAL